MEVLTMLKFWKSNSNKTSKVAARTSDADSSVTSAVYSTVSDHLSDENDNDDDDSYFELELTLPSKPSKIEQTLRKESKSFKVSDSKPQSPISIIRAASPKLRVFMFGNLAAKKKSSTRRTGCVEDFYESDTVSESCYYSPKRVSNDSNSSFSVKFRIEDGSIVPKFTRSRSSSSTSSSEHRNVTVLSQETSKRFGKAKVQKYLNLIRPKSLKKFSDGERFGCSSPTRCSTTPFSLLKEKEEKQSSRFKVKCKQLGKSKSASSTIGVSSPVRFPARNELPADGIEGAILHCKRSLKGNSSLSRCSSDPSHEKSIQVSDEV